MSKHVPSHLADAWGDVKASTDRRTAPRYSPNHQVAVWLGWQEGEEYRYCQAVLADISMCGSLVLSKELPPSDRPLWIRLDDPSAPDWVAARLVEGRGRSRGNKTLRLAFPEVCPFAFFKAAVNGFAPHTGLMMLPQDLKHFEL